MELISEKNIEIFNRKVSNMTEDEVEELGKQFADQQPYLMLFTLLLGNELNEDEQSELIFLGIKIWYFFKMLSESTIPTVEVTEIDAIQENNEQMASYFSSEEEPDFSRNMETMLEHYPQKYVLRYLVLELLGNGDSHLNLSVESQGVFFMILKVIIEALDKEQ